MLVAATVLLAVAWLAGSAWQTSPTGTSLVLGLLLPLVVLGGLTTVYVVQLTRSRRPATLEVRAGAFVAPPAYLRVAVHASVFLAIGAMVAGQALRDLADVPAISVPLLALASLQILLYVPSVRAVFGDQPRVELRPEGLKLFNVLGTRAMPWEAIAVGPYPRQRRQDVNEMAIGRPELVHRSGLERWLGQRKVMLPPLVATDPMFLAAAVNHYLFHAEHRAAIGTPAEYARLYGVLTGRPDAPPAPA
ncbi:hypothetical protein Prum_079960 [Phytohabitans rumicis]|uniref:Low molecular weight protein antigen 6 PH domain-containing protein n=1 Tax=Phytohabitans rumicis TaxID=1076125 RepID=A0A6V8LDF3_9ACTN|nr:hypothetical protein Prum_079960 [Phytohabitans rumicis]